MLQWCFAQICTVQDGFAQQGKAKVRTRQVGASEIRPSKVRSYEVSAAEIRAGEVCRTPNRSKYAAKGAEVRYFPAFWWIIMTIIRNIPESIFKRLSI